MKFEWLEVISSKATSYFLVVFYKGNPININLPTHVDLAVTETPPSFRGDTAQGGTKPATLETGHEIQVPLFINQNEKVKVDTRDSSYLGRVKS